MTDKHVERYPHCDVRYIHAGTSTYVSEDEDFDTYEISVSAMWDSFSTDSETVKNTVIELLEQAYSRGQRDELKIIQLALGIRNK